MNNKSPLEIELHEIQIQEFRELSHLAQHYDPFTADQTDVILKLLKKFQLEHLIHDPFQLTNEILKLLHKHDDHYFKNHRDENSPIIH
ncbi:MAG: hypothetical protein H6621_09085 [Halobacteriovoraceae bacterium]|nr:hypothetical protein [Halobacteriovoraceae bacterium]MCB9095208.1 hypothetical protein [Halobacteriovoraceae bacterium]